ncbi:MAG: hypothetical protein R2726_16400 [Acidimicrobiales bacterium]
MARTGTRMIVDRIMKAKNVQPMISTQAAHGLVTWVVIVPIWLAPTSRPRTSESQKTGSRHSGRRNHWCDRSRSATPPP